VTTPRYYAQIQDQRSDAFARVRRVFRWTTAGAVTAVALIVGVVAHEIPGRSASATTTSNNASGTPSTIPSAPPPTGGGTVSGGGGAVTPPVTVPTPTQRAPTAVSGGTGW
jgi:hypothetical protein